MLQALALTGVILAVVALLLLVALLTHAVLDRLDADAEQRCQQRDRLRRQERCLDAHPDAWRHWAAYYHGLAEQARAQGDAHPATTYDSLAETYRLLAGDTPQQPGSRASSQQSLGQRSENIGSDGRVVEARRREPGR